MSGSTAAHFGRPKTAPAHLMTAKADLHLMGARAGATFFDAVTVMAIVILAQRFLGLSLLTSIGLFFALRAAYETIAVAVCGVTAGKALLNLYASGHPEFMEPPRLRDAAIRHFVKSGDLFLIAAIGLLALAIRIGTPTQALEYFYLVALIPMAVAANIAYLATPVSLWVSTVHDREHQGFHDRLAGTYVSRRAL